MLVLVLVLFFVFLFMLIVLFCTFCRSTSVRCQKKDFKKLFSKSMSILIRYFSAGFPLTMFIMAVLGAWCGYLINCRVTFFQQKIYVTCSHFTRMWGVPLLKLLSVNHLLLIRRHFYHKLVLNVWNSVVNNNAQIPANQSTQYDLSVLVIVYKTNVCIT